MTLMILGHDVAVVAITKDGHTYASNNAVSIKSDWNQNRRGECICPEMPNTKECDCTACLLHNSTWLAGKCCIYRGIPASLLAFERDDLWIPRINEYNACTGARIQLTYNGRDGQGDEEAMEADLRSDVGVRYQRADGSIFETNGAGIYDAYVVQPPWLPAIVDGLANLSPWIAANPEIRWTDVNSALRKAVSFNNTVRALPLDTDYIALGWRQDVYDRFGLDPPETIQQLVKHSALLNGYDHNGDGEPDWGFCVTPQVNYLYAFVAPLMQTNTKACETPGQPCTGPDTEQNLFFNARTFEPFLDHPAMKEAVRLFSQLLQTSNCQSQLKEFGTCNRLTAFRTGRCAGVLSMPSTLTQMLLPDGAHSISVLRDNTFWQPKLGTDEHWGRRIRFPGSDVVYNPETKQLERCTRKLCPKAILSEKIEGLLINYAPFFPEGGESYAIRGTTSANQTSVMLDLFGWLSTLPVTRLPLSGQYRQSHLTDQEKQNLLLERWPSVMVGDLFDVLQFYFDENGNQAEDLIMLGYSEYFGALGRHIYSEFLLDEEYFFASDTKRSTEFDSRYSLFVEATLREYGDITAKYGRIQQVIRWRSSLDLQSISVAELCSAFELRNEPECQVTTLQQEVGNSKSWGTPVATVLSSMLLLILVGVILLRRSRSRALRKKEATKNLLRSEQKIREEMVQRFGYDPSLSPRYESLKVPRANIIIGAEIGRGGFGIVFVGQMRSGDKERKIAVKLLKEDVAQDQQDTFLYECRLLAMLDHPCILKIIGVQVDSKPVLLLTEFMQHGNLVTVLRNSPSHVMTNDVQYNILAKIADACYYLTSHNIIHRDIAARNVLVGGVIDDVRLSDFGMMPLEAIEKKVFCAASDVWSWAVMAWEVMTGGTSPWASHTTVETVLAVAKGERLRKPPCASDDLYSLMLRCWNVDPDERPTFRRIVRFFRGKCTAFPNRSVLSHKSNQNSKDNKLSSFIAKLQLSKDECVKEMNGTLSPEQLQTRQNPISTETQSTVYFALQSPQDGMASSAEHTIHSMSSVV
eukprot:gene5467-7168_t